MLTQLTPELLLQAYCRGIFPMGDDSEEIRWYSPDPRCIFDLENFHASKRLMRTYRSGKFELRVDTAWHDVIVACADRETTWISSEIYRVYTDLFRMGFAHTVEAYCDGELAGGLYGVALGGAFFGESMFHKRRDASKVALVYLVQRMKERGYTLLDAQYMTSHLNTFGAVNIPRSEYIRRLEHALTQRCLFV